MGTQFITWELHIQYWSKAYHLMALNRIERMIIKLLVLVKLLTKTWSSCKLGWTLDYAASYIKVNMAKSEHFNLTHNLILKLISTTEHDPGRYMCTPHDSGDTLHDSGEVSAYPTWPWGNICVHNITKTRCLCTLQGMSLPASLKRGVYVVTRMA